MNVSTHLGPGAPGIPPLAFKSGLGDAFSPNPHTVPLLGTRPHAFAETSSQASGYRSHKVLLIGCSDSGLDETMTLGLSLEHGRGQRQQAFLTFKASQA